MKRCFLEVAVALEGFNAAEDGGADHIELLPGA